MLQDKLTNRFPVSKTLKFELRPVGRTLEHMKSKGLLEEDEHRADSYAKVKKMIDEYHKSFIDENLTTLRLPVVSEGKRNSLSEYLDVFLSLDKGYNTSPELETIKKNLYRQIGDHFQKNPKFGRLFKKELIREDLKYFVADKEKEELISEFDTYTSYFEGFHTFRKILYSADGNGSSVGYRIVEDNLPVFVMNMSKYHNTVKNGLGKDILDGLYRSFEPYLNVDCLDKLFEMDNFNYTLNGQDIDVYNSVLGGFILEDGSHINGLNVLINLHNQQVQSKSKDGTKLPLLEPLKKQLLSDRTVLSWVPDKFENDIQLLQAVGDFYKRLFNGPLKGMGTQEPNLLNLISNMDTFDENRIYLSKNRSFGYISWALLGNPAALHRLVVEDNKKRLPRKKKETELDWESRIEKDMEKTGLYTLGYLNGLVNTMVDKKEKSVQKDYFGNIQLFATVQEKYEESKWILHGSYPEGHSLIQDEKAVECIKDLLDVTKELQNHIRPLAAGIQLPDADSLFYSVFTPMWNIFRELDRIYEKVGAYLMKKPYSVDKIKLNFRNIDLLRGWSVSSRRKSGCCILRKDGKYFLSVSDMDDRGLLEEKNVSEGEDNYELMNYRMLPKAAQMMPMMFLSDCGIRTYLPQADIVSNYKKGTHLKSNAGFSKDDMWSLIDYFKRCLAAHPDYGGWGYEFSDTSSYDDISKFYKEVDRQSYRVSFGRVSADHIDRAVEEGRLYLFQIWNKDFSEKSKGTPQLHTMYFKALFEEQNLSGDSVYRLNGGGELFFRKASIKKKRPTHPAGEPIANKNPLNPKRESVFGYDLIKDKRFTEDKFFLHLPLTMNWQANEGDRVSEEVNRIICEEDVNAIGIARGEKNILYACVIDSKGNVLERKSLNVIENDNGPYQNRTDYSLLVKQRMQQRDEAQKSWKSMQSIKDLLDGYLGQVVHVITNWMDKYNAVLVLENTDYLAKVGKPIMDKATLGRFERQLVEKLNYLVKKTKEPFETGGLYKAVQLTDKFDAFDKVGGRSGAVFFVSGIATAVTDPTTGYYNPVRFRFVNIEDARKTVSCLEGIFYDSSRDRFRIEIDFSKFTGVLGDTRTKWLLVTDGFRWKNRKQVSGRWNSREVGLTQMWADLLVGFGIDLYGDILKQILERTDGKGAGVKDFLMELMNLLQMTAQVRHVDMEHGETYICSPVENGDGVCFCDLEDGVDAVTAYNIARKGLVLVNRIRSAAGNKVSLSCTYQEWLGQMQATRMLE